MTQMNTAPNTGSGTTSTDCKPLVIFCHGSGDTGPGAQAWVESLVPSKAMEQWDWLFPTAEPIPYQLSGGMVSSVWYDRIGGFAPTFPEQTATVERSTDQLLALIEEQIQQGQRCPSSIAIGGFSMGGAIALQTAARWHAQSPDRPLGAVFGLSCYLNNDSKVWSLLKDTLTAKKWPPTFIAHGEMDDFILPKWGQATWERLEQSGVPMTFHLVPHAYHEMVESEMANLLDFLQLHTHRKERRQKQSTASEL